MFRHKVVSRQGRVCLGQSSSAGAMDFRIIVLRGRTIDTEGAQVLKRVVIGLRGLST